MSVSSDMISNQTTTLILSIPKCLFIYIIKNAGKNFESSIISNNNTIKVRDRKKQTNVDKDR